jgi:NADPH-dependent 2,4-dienoyl-CoA reductase/sulfur reductase-like enzyme
VIGAGPYGLSAAAFCRSAGATVQTFGRVMEFWSTRMPDGMILRSRWRSSHIADPTGTLGLDAYERVIGRALPDHIAIADFIEYGRWYQRQAVPELDQRLVRRLESTGTGFRLTLDDGAIHDSHAVILATGLEPFPHRPSPFSALPPELVSHSVDHRSLSGFRGKSVLVVGAGQSALEGAALLREIGARVEVIARASELAFLAPEEIVGAVQRLNLALRPPTDVGGRLTGWIAAAPDLFRTLPSGVRSRVGTRVVRPRGADWLRPRLAGVAVTLGRRPVAATAEDGRIRVALDDGTERQVDHVLLGTGYRMDVASYEFFDQELVGRLALRDGYPLLGPGLESSVPGLHFVGAPAALSFGPIMRFVVGTWYAAPAVAERVTRVRRRLLRLSYRPRRRDTGRSTARASLPDASGNGTHGGKATAVARSGSRPGS